MKQAQYANHQEQWQTSWRLGDESLTSVNGGLEITCKYVGKGQACSCFLSLSLCSKYLCACTCRSIHTLADTQIDCCTEKSIGDFIDESFKSSPKQNKLLTSQLESNGVMTIASFFSGDKWAFPSLFGSLTQIHSYSSDPSRPFRRKKPYSQMPNEACLNYDYCTCHSNYNWFAKVAFL